MTIACKYPSSRSRTIVFIRLKKESVLLEYSEKPLLIKSLSDFNDTIKGELKKRFNENRPKKTFKELLVACQVCLIYMETAFKELLLSTILVLGQIFIFIQQRS